VLDVDSRFVLVSLIKAKLGLIPAVSLPKNDDSWSFYYNFHQYIFTEEEDPTQGFGLFGRFGLADDETSPIEQFYSIGIGGKGIIDSRDNDTFGVGYYHVELSDKLPSVLLSRFGDSDGFELFYNFEVSPWLHITPDLQVVSPSDKSVDTAYIAGVRIKVDF
jgi:porin